jgi:hypothetical protein
MSDALLFVASIALLTKGAAEQHHPWAFSHIPGQMALATGYALLISLFPFRMKHEGSWIPNDGLHMIELLTASFRKSKGQPAAQEGAMVSSFGPSWGWTVRQIEPESLLQAYRQVLESPGLSMEERCTTLDGFVTTVLMFGAQQYLEEAKRYSAELFNTKPTDLSVKGTRGSVLIEIGEYEAGRGMLIEVMDNDPSSFDRGIAASFLAYASLKQGALEDGIEWLHAARKLDPNCPVIDRCEKLMRNQS